MPIIVPITDPDNAETTTEEVSRFLLGMTWQIAKDTGLCPICLVEVMHDMVISAHEKGEIEHIRMSPDEEDTMGEPITSTIQ